MADQEHLDRLKQGVEHWNQWRRKYQNVQPDLRGANLEGTDLSGANLSRANLARANFTRANLSGASLSEANLYGTRLIEADLRKAHLFYANFRETLLDRANLSGVNLRENYFIETHFNGTNLEGADLSGAPTSKDEQRGIRTVRGADLSRTDFRGANLSRTNLTKVDFTRANLSGANLTGATLKETFLSGANLTGATFSKARLFETTFAENDLSAVRGLAEIEHLGPSRVTLHTMKLPQDGSAFHFLQGTGIPNEWIDFYRSSMMMLIQYHSLFISYSNKDDMFARRLHADLQAHGVRCWFAPEDMKIGDKIRSRIDEAIHLQDKLLLLLSEHSLTSSWVEDEVEAALEKEQRQQWEVLFPIRLDEGVMLTSQAWAAKLRRTRHIGDFTRWTDPQEYQQAFERLLRDLKAQT